MLHRLPTDFLSADQFPLLRRTQASFTETVTGSFPHSPAASHSPVQRRSLVHKHQLLSLNAYLRPATAAPLLSPVVQRLEFQWHSYQWRQLCLVQCQLYCDRNTQQWSDGDSDKFNDSFMEG